MVAILCPFSSAVHVDGTIIDTIGKDVEENYNSVGYTAEVFIPWTSLSHDSKPETIDIFRPLLIHLALVPMISLEFLSGLIPYGSDKLSYL
jgi:hypothetical protein